MRVAFINQVLKIVFVRTSGYAGHDYAGYPICNVPSLGRDFGGAFAAG